MNFTIILKIALLVAFITMFILMFTDIDVEVCGQLTFHCGIS